MEAAGRALLIATGVLKPTDDVFPLKLTRLEECGRALIREARKLKPTDDASRLDTTKPVKKSTATERATSSSQPDPAVSTDDVSRLPLTGLPDSVLHDSVALNDKDLDKIVSLLVWMAQDFQSTIDIDEIRGVASEVVRKHSHSHSGGTIKSLDKVSLAKLSQLSDTMMLHKNGSRKDPNATLGFMRRVENIREHLRATWSDNATWRVELDNDEVSTCFHRFGRKMLAEDLSQHQKQDKRYRLRTNYKGDMHLSSFQRSFVSNLLRKFLGDKKVAFVIWQHGLPSIANLSKDNIQRHKKDLGMLQSKLKECLQWYISLANDIVLHRRQPGFDVQLARSSVDEKNRQHCKTRREALQKAQDALRRGEKLVKQRDDKKRSYYEMNDTEQKILEDYETGKLKKAKQSLTAPKMEPFRCKLQIKDRNTMLQNVHPAEPFFAMPQSMLNDRNAMLHSMHFSDPRLTAGDFTNIITPSIMIAHHV